LLLDDAAVQQQDAVGHCHRFRLVVGDDQRRQLHLDDQVAQPGAGFLAHLGVEVGQRLVEQDDRRVVDQRPGDRHPLLLAAGQLVRIAVGEVGQAEVLQRRLDAAADFGLGHLAQDQRVGDVVEHRLVRPQRVGLEDQAELAFFGRDVDVGGGIVDRPAGDGDAALVRLLQAGDGAQQGRLAGARGAEQGDDLAAAQLHRDALEDGIAAVGQGEVVDGQDGLVSHEVLLRNAVPGRGRRRPAAC
jgi:hypothetical protein